MKTIRTILSVLLTLCLVIALSAAVFADSEGFNARLDVTDNQDGSISVSIPEENAAILAAEKPTLTIPCPFSDAVVTKNGGAISSVTANGKVSFTVETPGVYTIWSSDSTVPFFASHSLLLSGEIGVNFYMDLSKLTEEEKAASSMLFSVCGRLQVDDFDASHTNPGGDGYYGFTCHISSVQMADTITAVFNYGDGRSVTQTYSAKDYIDYVNQNPGGFSADARALVASLGSYGANVQPFLAISNGWTLGEAHTAMTGGVSYDADALDTIRGTAANYAFGKDLGSSQVAKVSYSLDLQSKTALRVYFTLQPDYAGAVTATLDGSPVEAVRQDDGRYCVTVPSIAAHELGTAHSIVLSAGGSCTVTVSALSYVDAALRSSSKVFANDTARAAVASLYDYYAATTNYLANPAA